MDEDVVYLLRILNTRCDHQQRGSTGFSIPHRYDHNDNSEADPGISGTNNDLSRTSLNATTLMKRKPYLADRTKLLNCPIECPGDAARFLVHPGDKRNVAS
jgi:hypothetical protein